MPFAFEAFQENNISKALLKTGKILPQPDVFERFFKDFNA